MCSGINIHISPYLYDGMVRIFHVISHLVTHTSPHIVPSPIHLSAHIRIQLTISDYLFEWFSKCYQCMNMNTIQVYHSNQ